MDTSLRMRHVLGALTLFTATAALAAPTIEGCPAQPANNVWNARVDRLPVHARSSSWVSNLAFGNNGHTRRFHMDFGSGLYEGAPIGIPFVTVPGTQPKVPVVFDYDDESDPGPYPIPPNAPIEGGPSSDGDRHVLVIDRDNCVLYETFYSFPQNGGASWTAGSGAVFDLNSNELHPNGWTSADAAGLPIFPGLARFEEVQAGVIEHALRFTAQRTQRAYIWPARHFASSITDPNVPPMGARFRLRKNYDITGFSTQARIIAQAMKTYGLILADNGSPWYVSGAPNPGWDNDVLHELDVLRGADFEAVDTAALMVSVNSGEFVPPRAALTAVKAGASAAAGTVTSTPAGISCGATCSANIELGTEVTLVASAPGGTAFAGWSGDCSGTGACVVTVDQPKNVSALFIPVAERVALNPEGTAAFGGQSMGTTSPPLTVTVANAGTTTRTVSAVSIGAGPFTQTNNCGAMAPGTSCVVAIRYAPPVAAGPLNGSTDQQATLTVTSDGTVPSNAITVTGKSEKSLVSHYYRAILNRAADTAGFNFWSGEAARLAGLGANVNEAWFVMAGYFFNSPEYSTYQKSDAQFVADLYNTFFNRPPDAGGQNYWVGQIAGGLPREVVLFSFMFSPEFRTFTQAIFGNTAARPEVDMVVDLFRGILNRLPDSAAFNYWVGQLRTAQCQGAGPVYTAVDNMSYSFVFGAEYSNRARNNTQFVTDMYYSFLRRGGDTAGVQYWINELNTNARDRNNVRTNFVQSPEFGARVQAVIQAGCLP